MLLNSNLECYNFKKIIYTNGLLDDAVDATYIIHLEGNGRYEDILYQLSQFQPTKIVYIVFNKGYTKCQKNENIVLPAHDLVDAFLQIFKHSDKQNYGNILILEDDFIFSQKIKDISSRVNICKFLNNHKNENFQYLLGCIPIIKMPYTFDGNHFKNVISLGTHACIYSKINRTQLLKREQKYITDWDVYNNYYFRRYTYYEPLCYQLFPDTENSDNWGKDNYLLYLLGLAIKKIFKFFKLETKIEPGYSFFYLFSKIIFFVLLFIVLLIIYFIIYYVYNFIYKVKKYQRKNTKVKR
jgi:hypothetical protein